MQKDKLNLLPNHYQKKLIGTWSSKTCLQKYILDSNGLEKLVTSKSNNIKWKANETTAKLTIKIYSGKIALSQTHTYKFDGNDLIISGKSYKIE